MLRFFSVLFLCAFGGISANASTITMQYQFDATVVRNAVMCDYGVSQERYAADCGPSAMASPFEALDIDETYRGLITLTYADSARRDLSAVNCSIGGLNCSFADFGLNPPPPLAGDLNTSSRLVLGNGWNTMSYFDFGAGRYAYENDWDDFSVFQARLTNISVAPFAAAPISLTAAPSTFVTAVPLPGSLPLAAAGLALFGVIGRRRRQ